jgi:hypothetical protein
MRKRVNVARTRRSAPATDAWAPSAERDTAVLVARHHASPASTRRPGARRSPPRQTHRRHVHRDGGMAEGPVETEQFNFDALDFRPITARSEAGHSSHPVVKVLPRHLPVQIRALLGRATAGPSLSIGRVPNELTPPHTPVFHQWGLALDKELTMPTCAEPRRLRPRWFGPQGHPGSPPLLPVHQSRPRSRSWFANWRGPRLAEWGGCRVVNPMCARLHRPGLPVRVRRGWADTADRNIPDSVTW